MVMYEFCYDYVKPNRENPKLWYIEKTDLLVHKLITFLGTPKETNNMDF